MATVPVVLGSFDSVALWFGALGLVFFAEVVYVALGFGAGMIALGGLVFLMGDPRDAVVVLLLVTAPVQIWILLEKFGRRLKFPHPWIAAGALLGVPVGTYVLRSLGSRELLLILGFVLLAATAILALSRPARAEHSNPALEPFVGFLSGTLSGAFGTGASPMILYLQWAGLPRSEFRATMMSVFLVSSLARVPTYAFAGLFTGPRVWAALLLAPAVAGGLVVGQRLHRTMNEVVYRRAVLVGLAMLGLALVARNL